MSGLSTNVRIVLLLTGLTGLGVFTHLLPHAVGISTVGALSMLSAAYLPQRLIAVPVLITIAVADLVSGVFYGFLPMCLVYGGYLLGAICLVPLLKRLTLGNLMIAAGVNALVFNLVSNASHMVLGFYPNTLEGWLACYRAGTPFIVRGFGANLAFAGIAFAAIHVVQHLLSLRPGATRRR